MAGEARKRMHQELLERFDKDGDGKLNREELAKAYARGREKMDRMRQEALKEFDADGDGMVSFAELLVVMPALSEAEFQALDADADGLLRINSVADLDEQLDYFTLTAADVEYAYGFTHNRFSCAHAASAIQRIALLGVDTELGKTISRWLGREKAPAE